MALVAIQYMLLSEIIQGQLHLAGVQMSLTSAFSEKLVLPCLIKQGAFEKGHVLLQVLKTNEYREPTHDKGAFLHPDI